VHVPSLGREYLVATKWRPSSDMTSTGRMNGGKMLLRMGKLRISFRGTVAEAFCYLIKKPYIRPNQPSFIW
jgi:hypothetical protein